MDAGTLRIEHQSAREGRSRALGAGFDPFDAGSDGGVEEPPGGPSGLHGQAQAGIAGLTEEEGFTGGEMVDLPDITALAIAAQLVFQIVEVLKAFPGKSGGLRFLLPGKPEGEGRMHGLVTENGTSHRAGSSIHARQMSLRM